MRRCRINASARAAPLPRRVRGRGTRLSWYSGLLDIPQKERRRLNIALEVLAERGVELVLAGRDIRHHLEGALLDFGRDRLPLLKILRLQPFGAQRLELVIF